MKASILLCLLFAGIVFCQEEDATKDIKAVRGVFEVSRACASGLGPLLADLFLDQTDSSTGALCRIS
jgi:hypothetical protein